ncbi:MAG: ParB N-terminal domain-containing protein [Holophaga sp.]|nr:ParB N-terminal domain-containing protein [Holophaga sp.]
MAKLADSKQLPPKKAETHGNPSSRFQGRGLVVLDQIDTTALRTRDINETHVMALAESIAAIGLIHPPVLDRFNRLLAGGHRIAALRWLEKHSNARFLELFPDGIPAWRMDLDAKSDVDLALAVEISENEQRRDYSSSEVLKLADRLKAAGFHYSTEGGRPKADTRPLMPALEIIVGKSVRQLRRILNPPGEGKSAARKKTRPDDLVLELQKFQKSMDQIVARLAESSEIPELFTLKGQLERVNRLMTQALAALGGTE